MDPAAAVSVSLVVYAKDIDTASNFYRNVLGLAALETHADFALVGNGSIEISVVRIPDAIAADITITSPPGLREDTPLKFSFLVGDLAPTRERVIAAGGGARPLDAAWEWRGQRHLDGHDPEGNVVQFRQAIAA